MAESREDILGKKITEDITINSDEAKALVKEALSKTGLKMSKEEKIDQAKILMKVLDKKQLPYEAMGFTERDVALIYAYAYKIFNAGQFKEACEVFKVLATLNPVEAGFAVGLGACYHKLKDYQSAATSYMAGTLLDPQDPVPFFYTYDCLLNLDDAPSAAMMLQKVIRLSSVLPRYAKLKEKAIILLTGLEKQLEEENIKNKKNTEEGNP